MNAEAALGNYETCKLLLDRAIQLGYRKEVLAAKNGDSMLALQVACERGHVDVARLLLEEGSPILPCPDGDVKVKKQMIADGSHPFQLARKGLHWDICELIADRKKSIFFLHEAVSSGNVELVDKLISLGYGSDINTLFPGKKGKSCLEIACTNNDIAMITRLVEKYGAEIIVRAFNEACRIGSIELVRFLLGRASGEVINNAHTLTQHDRKKLTQDFEAKMCGDDDYTDDLELEYIVESYKAPTWFRYSTGHVSALEVACENNRLPIIRV